MPGSAVARTAAFTHLRLLHTHKYTGAHAGARRQRDVWCITVVAAAAVRRQKRRRARYIALAIFRLRLCERVRAGALRLFFFLLYARCTGKWGENGKRREESYCFAHSLILAAPQPPAPLLYISFLCTISAIFFGLRSAGLVRSSFN